MEVRVGEHDLKNDCKESSDVCDPAVDFTIEKTHVHPNYTKGNNDIALIRLKKAVNLTILKYVKTICLPLKEENHLNTSIVPNFTLTLMGFGKTETGNKSDVMLKTDLPYIEKEECKSFYKERKMKNINEFNFCAGGDKKDSCNGKIIKKL